jgi:Spy/CpxP family protein refolding chaperone
MKVAKFKVVVVMVLLLMQSSVFAHNNKKMNKAGHDNMHHKSFSAIPNITEEQEAKLKELRLDFIKERQSIMNVMREKRAHLITLQSEDKVDMSAVNKTIDEITELQNKQLKNMAKQRQAVRNILTDEQKVFFDSHHNKSMDCSRATMMNRDKGNHNMKRDYYKHEHEEDDED